MIDKKNIKRHWMVN